MLFYLIFRTHLSRARSALDRAEADRRGAQQAAEK